MIKHALCIGINDYPGTDSDLAGCINDANDWMSTFKQRGFETSSLFDKQATGKAVRKAIQTLLSDAKSGDLVVVQYSGHGSFVPDEDGDEPDGTDECLCPYDIRKNGPITDDELFQIYVSRRQGVKVLMISDSCHSGTVARFAPITTPPTTRGKHPPRRKVRFLPPSSFLSKRDADKLEGKREVRRSSPPGRYASLLMAGCQDTEYSYDAYFNDKPNGAFTFVALQTLSSLPKKATYMDWYKAIRKILPSQQYPQTPNLYGSTGMKRWNVLT